MATRLLTSIILFGAATRAFGTSPADPSCGHPNGDACGAADHSLLQVVSAHSNHKMRAFHSHGDKARAVHSHGDKARAFHGHGEEARAFHGHGDEGRAFHSHGQIPGRGSGAPDEALAGFLADRARARADSESGHDQHENRTITNITKGAEHELDELEQDVDLLVLGRHKLCASEGKNAGRVKELWNILKVENPDAYAKHNPAKDPYFLQVLARESPSWKEKEGLQVVEQKEGAVGESQSDGAQAESASQSDWSADEGEAGSADSSEHEYNSVQADSAGEAIIADSAVQAEASSATRDGWTDSALQKVDNRTLKNISANVAAEVASVSATMDEIQKEGYNLEALGAEVSARLEVLVSLLKTEMPDCEASGDLGRSFLENPHWGTGRAFLLQKGTRSGGKGPAVQSVLQGSQARAESRQTWITALLNPDKNQENVTFANLSIMIKEDVALLENDVATLVEAKNKLGVTDSDGAKRLDNLESTMKGEYAMLDKNNLLQTGEAASNDTELADLEHNTSDATAKKSPPSENKTSHAEPAAPQHNTSDAAPHAAATVKKDKKEHAKPTKEAAIAKKEEEEHVKPAKEEESDGEKSKEDEESTADAAELQKEELTGKANEKQEGQQSSAADPVDLTPLQQPGPLLVTPNMGHIPLINLTIGVEHRIADLEADVDILSEKKHLVCIASQEVMQRLQVVIDILAKIEC